MKWVLLILGFIILFIGIISYTKKLMKLYKEEQDDFKNANHLSKRNNK